MKRSCGIVFMCLAIPCWCSAEVPQFERGMKIQSDGQDIDVSVGHLVPNVADWNGDGKKDLIVGQFSGGIISLYLNQGTNDKPLFKGCTQMQAGGKPIRLDAG